MRFLLSRRWLLFAVAVVLLTWLAVVLGQWQFGRLEDRRAENTRVERNLERAAAPAAEVLSTRRQPHVDDEWRRVTVTGTWDDAHTVVVKYQTRDGVPGVDVVTPLRTADGTAVIVDRGWLALDKATNDRPDLPAATAGTIAVTGWVRRDATGDSARVTDLSTRAVSSVEIAEVLGGPAYQGFLDLAEQDPPSDDLELAEPPDTSSEGPHFFYGLQWWFFGALAVFGFGYLAWDELRKSRRVPKDAL